MYHEIPLDERPNCSSVRYHWVVVQPCHRALCDGGRLHAVLQGLVPDRVLDLLRQRAAGQFGSLLQRHQDLFGELLSPALNVALGLREIPA
jgi:hypothetical protein